MEHVGERIERPWATWTPLETGTRDKVEQIEVLTGKRLSLQRHFHRSEHWVVVQGKARVTNGDWVTMLETNQSTFIPLGALDRLEDPNSSTQLIIEFRNGNDLREMDIIRLEDDLGRDAIDHP